MEYCDQEFRGLLYDSVGNVDFLGKTNERLERELSHGGLVKETKVFESIFKAHDLLAKFKWEDFLDSRTIELMREEGGSEEFLGKVRKQEGILESVLVEFRRLIV